METKDVFSAAGQGLETKDVTVPGYVPSPLVLGDERRVPGDQREDEDKAEDGKSEDEKDSKDEGAKGTTAARKTASGSGK